MERGSQRQRERERQDRQRGRERKKHLARKAERSPPRPFRREVAPSSKCLSPHAELFASRVPYQRYPGESKLSLIASSAAAANVDACH